MVYNLDNEFNVKRKREMSTCQEVEQTVVHDCNWLPSENLMKKPVPSVN
jgi:hypothetical protein